MLWSIIAGNKFVLLFVYLIIAAVGLAVIGIQFALTLIFITDSQYFTCDTDLPFWWLIETLAFAFALLSFTYNAVYLIKNLILQGSADDDPITKLRCGSVGLEVVRVLSILGILFYIAWTLVGVHWLKGNFHSFLLSMKKQSNNEKYIIKYIVYRSCITSLVYKLIVTWTITNFFLFFVGFIIIVTIIALGIIHPPQSTEQTPFFQQKGAEYH